MPYLDKTTAAADSNISIFYEDYGTGKPVILIHGWPLSSAMWEYQTPALIDAGYRVIQYDRRGFGHSSRPWDGYTYKAMAEDLKDLMDKLDLQDVTLVGFSMGGGEIAQYVDIFGNERLHKLIFVSSIAPFMLKTDDNENGVPKKVFEDMKAAVSSDRAGFLPDFGENFVNYNDNKDKVSQGQLDYNFNIAVAASPKATLGCIDAFGKTDLRDAMKKIDVPTLFIHGDADNVVPMEPTSKQGHELVKDSKLEIIKDAPHGLYLTHKQELNKLLIDFID
ncbi:alpha/beta fold hydrolase [Nonlabens ponticola]|uniref:Alpha/beta hydrolase n=1 Tax=Nonlabens ponticola TaxID=2496866 RepID=A0A3S9MYH2_9FLAO|nr:alpha/beta hydrolase [Nonlabens ponticola]AZQ44230.1 alpha/beta hydrolase [Nonlabens ponticola]